MRGVLSVYLTEPFRKSDLPIAEAPVFEEMRAGAHEYPRLVIPGSHFGKEAPPEPIHFRAALRQNYPWDEMLPAS